MTDQQALDFERLPSDTPPDETGVNLRAYISRLPEERLKEYDSSWSDERLMEWDGNFRSDGGLMLVCCERDVDVQEYRKMLEEYLRYRKLR